MPRLSHPFRNINECLDIKASARSSLYELVRLDVVCVVDAAILDNYVAHILLVLVRATDQDVWKTELSETVFSLETGIDERGNA